MFSRDPYSIGWQAGHVGNLGNRHDAISAGKICSLGDLAALSGPVRRS